MINAQVNSSSNNIEDIAHQTKRIQDILKIVVYTYNITLDEKSLNFEKFVTHLRFFFKRLNKKQTEKAEDDFLLNQVKAKYKKAFDCMLKIELYLEEKLSEEE